jgi:trans-2-enoyl-CoA reductase
MSLIRSTTVVKGLALSSSFGFVRFYAAVPSQATVARFEKNGDPEAVLKVVKESLKPAAQSEVTVKFLFSPINPADLGIVRGNYPSTVTPPAVGGSEGVAEVLQVGPGVTDLKAGDLVLPSRPGIGTWRSHATLKASDVFSVPAAKGVKPEYLATLSVNPATALRLLEDFETLKAGDVIVQNGANSMVGLSVIQLANARGIKTVNIIRRTRTDYAELIERMKNYGAFIVVGDDYIRTGEFRKLIADLPRPRLALNCVGGPTATEMVRLLAPGGTMVTYGGMSLKPVTVPTSSLIFNDVRLRGFWLTRWNEKNGLQGKKKTVEQLVNLVQTEKLRLWTETHAFNEKGFPVALNRAVNSNKRDRKVLLQFE